MCGGGAPPKPRTPPVDKTLEAEKVARANDNATRLFEEKEKRTEGQASKLYGLVGRRSLLAPLQSAFSSSMPSWMKMGG